jgi:RNA polymerase sigma factor (TIGR02999 family)
MVAASGTHGPAHGCRPTVPCNRTWVDFGMREQNDVTGLLNAANEGDPDALGQVLSLLYDRLRVIAHRQLAGEAEGHTLETDGLVHETYLRLTGVERMRWRDRQHVLAMAARTMRRVLIDYADRRRAQKRGDGIVPAPLDPALVAVDEHSDDLRALDEALRRLEAVSLRQSQVVECRFFAGLSVDETARALGLSPATVKRDWLAARAWLNRELQA